MNTVTLHELKTAYAYKTTRELRFTYWIFTLLHYPTLVKILSRMAEFILQYRLPFKGLIRSTVFKVFCCGENEKEAFHTIAHLHQHKVLAVLDYVSEGEHNDTAFNSNTEKIIANIYAEVNGTHTDFISVKLTGLESPDFLADINCCFRQLNGKQLERYTRFVNRVNNICEAAAMKQIMVYIDAEESWMQDVIDHLTEEMMRTYNTRKVIVFNTLQMYRTDRLEYLKAATERAVQGHYYCGIKLVRGAYLEKETLKAAEAHQSNPVFERKEDTDAAFNAAVEWCLRHHEVITTCVATHNEESISLALRLVDELQIPQAHKKLQFSQLFGMSDHLTFNLAASGYPASKYLPYGEVEKAIPYLIRRASENTSVNGQMNRDLQLLKQELHRRSVLQAN